MGEKILLDVDVGCDDAATIAMALGEPSIDVVGITTCQGNTTLENATTNALGVLELFNRTDVPVARGAHRPLTRDPITAEAVHGPAGIRGELPEPTVDPLEEHAVEFLIEQAETYGSDLTICATAPQTNIALALAQAPWLAETVGDIYVMGGAALASRSIEGGFNYKNDPEAASRVFQEASPKIVGVDATFRAPLTADAVDELTARGPPFDTIAEWMRYPDDILAQPENFLRESVPGPVVHDAVVMADIIDDVLEYEEYYVEVMTGDDRAAGRLLCDYQQNTGNEPNAAVALDADQERYQRVFLQSLEALA